MEDQGMQESFYGWYMKCQSHTGTLAVIPAVHCARHQKTCSVQLITDDSAYTAWFPGKAFSRRGKNISIGDNHFSQRGMVLSVDKPGLSVKGRLRFGPLTPLRYDIMGPFALVPFMECRHHVWSMRHRVLGTVCVNGRNYSFQNETGYWEGDSGRSFPKEYVWTQCLFPQGSLMLAVAEIPVAGMHFTGIIGAVLWKGREYRLATYLGARLAAVRNGIVQIAQNDMRLEARLLKRAAQPLKAPVTGDMTRTIHESAACTAYYRFQKAGQTLFAFESPQASFEYEYPIISPTAVSSSRLPILPGSGRSVWHHTAWYPQFLSRRHRRFLHGGLR